MRPLPFVAVLLLWCPVPTSAQTWAGKKVYPKNISVKLSYTGKKTPVKLKNLLYKVEKEDQGWLKIRQQGLVGWIRKTDAVLLENAISYFTSQIRANGGNLGAYMRRADAWRRKGELDIALKDYNDAIRLAPTDRAVYNNRGNLWKDKKDYDKALRDYSEAIRLDPKYAATYRNRGDVYYLRNLIDKALADYNKAMRLDPSDPIAYNNRGVVWYFKKGDPGKALADYNEAI